MSVRAKRKQKDRERAREREFVNSVWSTPAFEACASGLRLVHGESNRPILWGRRDRTDRRRQQRSAQNEFVPGNRDELYGLLRVPPSHNNLSRREMRAITRELESDQYVVDVG